MIEDAEPGTPANDAAGEARTAPLQTGNRKVDEALAPLDALEALPLAEQAERLLAACDRLGVILEER